MELFEKKCIIKKGLNMIADEIDSYTDTPTEIQMMNMATEVMQDLSIELVDGNCDGRCGQELRNVIHG